MATSVLDRQRQFYQEWFMAQKFDPSEFGVDIPKDQFTDMIVDDFSTAFRGMWTVDELLLHPRDAMRFCEDVRYRHGYFECPDHIILRLLLNRRKNP